jgi:cytochrome b561
MPNNDPQKIGVLLLHMAVRLIVRLRTSRPPNATTGYPRLDRLAPLTHYGFYVLVLLMVATGYAPAISPVRPQGRTVAADVCSASAGQSLWFRQDS